MAKALRSYQKLTRAQAGLGRYSSLWLGADHILLVQSTGYREEYQRIQLGDIQAILVSVSDRRQNWAIAWGVVGVIALLPLVVALFQYETPIFSAIFLGIAVVVFLINHLLGPTCRVSVVTRVQTTRFPLVRRRKADKVLARLQPLIEAAQADLLTSPDVVPLSPPPFT